MYLVFPLYLMMVTTVNNKFRDWFFLSECGFIVEAVEFASSAL